MNCRGFLPFLVSVSITIGFTLRPQWAQGQASNNSVPHSCTVTVPNHSQPPAKNFGGSVTYSPDYSGPREGPVKNSHGNGSLWTMLWPDGIVVFRPGGPGFVLSDGSLSMKLPWWRGVRGKLTIQGRRLDRSAPSLRADIPEGYGDTGFQATALIFPTEGCWEVTGRAGDASLTFVTRVVRAQEAK
jgi:hypothetical protein